MSNKILQEVQDSIRADEVEALKNRLGRLLRDRASAVKTVRRIDDEIANEIEASEESVKVLKEVVTDEA